MEILLNLKRVRLHSIVTPRFAAGAPDSDSDSDSDSAAGIETAGAVAVAAAPADTASPRATGW